MERLSRSQIQEAEKLGGSEDQEWSEYSQYSDPHYSEKGGHAMRSLFNAPNHESFFKKNGIIQTDERTNR